MKKILTIIVICGAVLTLAFLGTWQVQRLLWKKDIIEKLDAEYKKQPDQNIYSSEALMNIEKKETPILYGSSKGKFTNNKPIFLQPKIHQGKVGAHVIHPFNLQNSNATILVNRGWINKDDIENFKFSKDDTKEKIISGIFRKPDWNRFTSENSPSQNIWTKADINQITAHYNLEESLPVILYATEIEDNKNLILQDTKWYPRNKHLQYAIFCN